MMTGASGRRRIGPGFVKSYKVPVPPMHIQEQIIEKLEMEDKMIDSQRDIVSLFENKIKDKLTSLWQKKRARTRRGS
jgi:type I restriction enzyme M protein